MSFKHMLIHARYFYSATDNWAFILDNDGIQFTQTWLIVHVKLDAWSFIQQEYIFIVREIRVRGEVIV